MSHVPVRLWEEVDKWRRNSGLDLREQEPTITMSKGESNQGQAEKSKTRGKGKGKAAARPSRARDWGEAAERLEIGAIDMSHGDPFFD